MPITEAQINGEARSEFLKPVLELAKDAIREANTLPTAPASQTENLDIIKHLVKRLMVHQVSLDANSRRAMKWLIVLSVIMAIGSIFQVLSFFSGSIGSLFQVLSFFNK